MSGFQQHHFFVRLVIAGRWILFCLVSVTFLQVRSLEATSSESAPYAFPISEEQVRSLIQTMAPRVDLFREVWEKDPNAEFFAGTARDFTYWILGHFRGLTNPAQTEAAKEKLLAIPFIQFREIVGPFSDADIITTDRNQLSSISGEDFGIRSIDFISNERTTPGSPMYNDEWNQGFIPAEKMRLKQSGIIVDDHFGNGLGDLTSGKLQIQFPDTKLFWTTHYAKSKMNHPSLLALRYLRILSQDYLHRHGSGYPDLEKLKAPMSKDIEMRIGRLINDARKDSSFAEVLKHEKGKKFVNGAIHKSFRSYTNPTATFKLMEEMEVNDLIESFPDQIESIHQYLLQMPRNESQISQRLREYHVDGSAFYLKLEDYLPNRELIHGTSSEPAFRNIIYQGIIPSESGSAGRGLYGVSSINQEFAIDWSLRESGRTDLVIGLSLKEKTRLVDIRKGPGKDIYDRWKRDFPKKSIEDFCQEFGIDLLLYPYKTEAFVLKNSSCIVSKRGIFKNPRPLRDLMEEAESVTSESVFEFLKNYFSTPLSRSESEKVEQILKKKLSVNLLEEPLWTKARKELGTDLYRLLKIFITDNRPSDPLYERAWDRIFLLLDDADYRMRFSVWNLFEISNWHPKLWERVPELLKKDRQKKDLSDIASQELRSLVQALVKESKRNAAIPTIGWKVLSQIIETNDPRLIFKISKIIFQYQEWPTEFWDKICQFLSKNPDPKANDPSLSRENIFSLLASLIEAKNWPPGMKAIVESFLSSDQDSLQYISLEILAKRTPHSKVFWSSALSFLQHEKILLASKRSILSALAKIPLWPDDFWKAIQAAFDFDEPNRNEWLVEIVAMNQNWPKFFTDRIEGELRSSTIARRISALWLLQSHHHWQLSTWAVITPLISDPEPSIRLYLTEAIRYQNEWPQEILNSLTVLLRDSKLNIQRNFSRSLAEYSMRSKHVKWSEKVWASVIQSLKTKNASDRHWDLLYAIGKQDSWPDEFWQLLPQLMKTKKSRISEALAEMITTRPMVPKFMIPKILKQRNPEYKNDNSHWDQLRSRISDGKIEVSSKPEPKQNSIFGCISSLKAWGQKILRREA